MNAIGIVAMDVAAWMESYRPKLLESTGIVTAGGVSAETEEFLLATPCRILLKPFTAEQLTDFVRDLIRVR